MKNKNNYQASGGIAFCGLLAVAFIVLKLLGIIKWSWIWVLAPLWMPTLLAIFILTIFLIWAKR